MFSPHLESTPPRFGGDVLIKIQCLERSAKPFPDSDRADVIFWDREVGTWAAGRRLLIQRRGKVAGAGGALRAPPGRRLLIQAPQETLKFIGLTSKSNGCGGAPV